MKNGFFNIVRDCIERRRAYFFVNYPRECLSRLKRPRISLRFSVSLSHLSLMHAVFHDDITRFSARDSWAREIT